MKKKYDIGVVTVWPYCNYGSRLTSWAIYKVLNDMGYSVLMIAPPISSLLYKEGSRILEDARFQSLPYDKEDLADIPFDILDCVRFNDICECFLIPSDQNFARDCWNKNDKIASLNWVRSGKGKVGYSVSFGYSDFWGGEKERLEMKYFLKRFDAIAVREQSAIKLMRENFDINTKLVLDPVFLCDREDWLKLAQKGNERIPKGSYILTFILKPPHKDIELEEILEECRRQLGIDEVINIPDPIYRKPYCGREIKETRVEEWLSFFLNAECIVTNSFHAACFAILFQKQFVILNDYSRGATRIDSLMGIFGFTERIVYKQKRNRIIELFREPMDYGIAEERMIDMKNECLTWLKTAVEKAKNKCSEGEALDTYDIFFEQMLTMNNQIKMLNNFGRGEKMVKDKFELYKKTLSTEADIVDPYKRRMTNNFDFITKWFYINKNNKSVSREIKNRGYKKIAIYGAARIGQLLYDELIQSDEIEVVYIMDQSVDKLAEREVYRNITDDPIDAVIVTAINYFVDIKRKLHGYTRADIISLEEIVSHLYDTLVEEEFNKG